MELNEYQKQAMTTCMDSCHNDAYMFYGIVGELGEFASKIAKAIRKSRLCFNDDNNLYTRWLVERDNEELAEALKAELGDVLWFIAGISDKLGLTLDEIAQGNLDKLASRKQRGVIDGDGDNR